MLNKFVGMASIGSSFANIALLQRFLEGIVGVIALTILSAMMAGMLIMSAFYGLYLGLTRYGLDPDAALVAVVAIGSFLTAALSALTVARLRQLRELPLRTAPMPTLSRLTNVTHAFIDGFKAHPSNTRN